MPFGACQNEGNHWFLIFIKYHDDKTNCIFKMFLKNYYILYNGKKDVMLVLINYVYDGVTVVYIG